jgi:hypothetical protein
LADATDEAGQLRVFVLCIAFGDNDGKVVIGESEVAYIPFARAGNDVAL